MNHQSSPFKSLMQGLYYPAILGTGVVLLLFRFTMHPSIESALSDFSIYLGFLFTLFFSASFRLDFTGINMIASFVSLLLLSTSAFCKTPDASTWKDWVPVGWKLISSATGDLNQDGKSDAVLVLEEDNPANRKPNNSLGAAELNLNPRRLLILFKTTSGYQKIVDTNHFLPSENDADSPCLADPLDDNGIQVSRGLLKIELQYWLSCGSYGVTNRTFSFRYENKRFRLVGMDVSEFSRSTGESSEYSTNYLTGKKKITTGFNEFEESESKPKAFWKKISSPRKFYLDEMNSSCYSNEGKTEDWCQ